jgi:tRNA(adenine34) deaminase
MARAIEEARSATDRGEVPVGAVILDREGAIVAADHNRREALADPTAHAEILVLRTVAEAAGSWRLDGHTLVVTLEPCPMCAGAAVAARIERIVYGAADLQGGGCWSLYNIPQDERLNHQCELASGVRADECRRLLEDFFSGRRPGGVVGAPD